MGFMQFFTIQRQFILFVVSVVAIVPLHLWAGFAGSWLPVLIILILLIKHLLIGTVNAAAMKLQFGDFEGAEKILKYTWKPSWLQMGFDGMYYLIQSRIEFQKKNYKKAEKISKKALTLDLQDDFKAMIYLQLMNIYGQRKKTRKVKELYKKCKELNVTQEMLKQNIKEVGQMLKGKHKMQKKMMGRKAQRSMKQSGYMRRNRKKR